jgi:hypothetical protein
MTAAVAIVWNRLPPSSLQMQFADFDSLALIWSSSQLAFILQSRLSGFSVEMTVAIAIDRMVLGFHLRKCVLPFSIWTIHSGN